MLDGATMATSLLPLLFLARLSSTMGFGFRAAMGRSLGIFGTGGAVSEGIGSGGNLNDLFIVPSLLRPVRIGRFDVSPSSSSNFSSPSSCVGPNGGRGGRISRSVELAGEARPAGTDRWFARALGLCALALGLIRLAWDTDWYHPVNDTTSTRGNLEFVDEYTSVPFSARHTKIHCGCTVGVLSCNVL